MWCLSGSCSAGAIVAGLDLAAADVLPGASETTFSVRHALKMDESAGKTATSWAPQDVLAALSGDYEPERTEILRRADGIALFYPGRVHWLMGESESGKSWVALLAAAEALNAGERALFVDFESDLQTVGRRLLALGVPLGVLADGLTYIRPSEKPLPGTDAEREFAGVLRERYRFATVDGITDALMVYGFDPNSGTEVAEFIRAVPRRIADETTAAVVCVDHVTKSNDGRGRFAIGSQHKMAGLDGIAYNVAPVEPIAPGKRGIIVLRVAKDRPGWVRSHAGMWSKADRTQEAARVVLDSTTPGRTAYVVDNPETYDAETGEARPFRPTVLMERISQWIETNTEATRTALKAEVPGATAGKAQALALLVEEGYVTEERRQGRGGGSRLVSARPFRADEPNPEPGLNPDSTRTSPSKSSELNPDSDSPLKGSPQSGFGFGPRTEDLALSPRDETTARSDGLSLDLLPPATPEEREARLARLARHRAM
ncbi:AAA family ATPase [Micromonospora sp. NPDC005305]|uniref:AAA family ATPase n=1 Tax=Micromonospora sp. NPDC005305 TaxID=3156875 RepID=UPI0033B2C055